MPTIVLRDEVQTSDFRTFTKIRQVGPINQPLVPLQPCYRQCQRYRGLAL